MFFNAKLEHAFWLLCSMHAVMQVPPDEAVKSRTTTKTPLELVTP